MSHLSRRVCSPAGARPLSTGPCSVEGLARAIIDFVRQLLTMEDQEETVAGVRRHMEAVGFGQALETHH